MSESARASSHSEFWNVRYDANDHLFGTEPNAFVASQVHRLAPESDVVEVGAGEGRTLIALARDGHRVTAVDFAGVGLEAGLDLAERYGVDLATVAADVRTWAPDRRWDAAVVTFLQLLPDERPELYALLRRIVRPGGWILGEWFRPDHLTDDFARIGPSRADRMVPVDEVRDAFSQDEIVHCAPADVDLDEGDLLNGPAAVVRLVVRRA